ncbi:MAG TPA: tetratricopeptide repeat protein [Leptospiraceae bacterium]|nr:tetratricopeptide repeat protein [Leptospiraceae bacterium]HNO25694.1 tetratricopeptide repeat protein [Leptospiraceae bacterium]
MKKTYAVLAGALSLSLGLIIAGYYLYDRKGVSVPHSGSESIYYEKMKEGEELLKQNSRPSIEKALSIFTELYAKDIQNSEDRTRIRFGLALALEKNKDRFPALDIYRELNQDSSLNKEQKEKLSLHLGRLLLKLSQEEEGKIHLDSVLKTSSDKKLRSESLAAIADFYYKKKDLDQARKNYFSAIQEDSNNLHARLGLTRTLRGLGRDLSPGDIYENFIEYTFPEDKVIPYEPKDKKETDPKLGDFFKRGKYFFDKKKYQEAVRNFTRALEKTSDSLQKERVLYYISEAYYHLRNYDRSLHFINEVILNPNPSLDQASEYRKGIILYELKKYKESVSAFNSVIEKYPANTITDRAKDYRNEAQKILGEQSKYKDDKVQEDSEDE